MNHSEMHTPDFDLAIIGGGIIGMAIARLYSANASVLLIEQHPRFGEETSSRNSEVIHAGLYYPEGSLKESLCLEGKHSLYAFCEAYDVPFQRIGKLIVSPTPQHPKLIELEAKANRLDIEVQRLNRAELAETEPHIRAAEALFSPTTGIIDSHCYLSRLEQQASENGALLMNRTRFIKATPHQHHWQILLDTDDGRTTITAAKLINAAGLNANQIASQMIEQGGQAIDPLPLFPCRGEYFSYQGQAPFQHLIYPLPEANLAGLGIHATLDMGGGLRFGPNVRYLSSCALRSAQYDCDVTETSRQQFVHAIQRYFPTLEPHRLQTDYAGIRPKLHSAQSTAQDFRFLAGPDHVPPSLHLLGMESPGLTASLAIAETAIQHLA